MLTYYLKLVSKAIFNYFWKKNKITISKNLRTQAQANLANKQRDYEVEEARLIYK